MSLPRELLEDLLSRYMDDGLSEDERRRVEQMLESDDSVRNHLQSLQRNAELLRDTRTGIPGLGSDFANRVMAAALEQAEQEDLPQNHPLRLAAASTSTQSSPRYQRAWIGVIATAAAIAFVGFFLWRPSDTDSVNPLAMDTVPGPDSTTDPVAGSSDVSPEDLVASESGTSSASTGANPLEGTAVAAETIESGNTTSMVADAAASTTSDAVGEDSDPQVPRVGSTDSGSAMLADAGNGTNSVDPKVTASNEPGAMVRLQAMMVYEVQLTEAGIENNIVGKVFRQTGIESTDQREVDDNLVGFLRDSDLVGEDLSSQTEGERANVLFLEGSGLKLDALMIRFLQASGDVKRVGFSLVQNPPVLTSVENLKEPVEVNQVRQPENSGSLVATKFVLETGVPADDEFAAGGRDYFQLKANQFDMMKNLQSQGDQQPGNDITAQVLLIIRY